MTDTKLPRKSLVMEGGPSAQRMLKLGEPFIWLAGAASALTLFMILFLLAVIALEGTVFFWPKPVVQVALKDGTRLAGLLWERERYETKDENGRILSVTPRIQLMTGNRDLTAKDFVWIDESQIAARDLPKGVLYVERREWGPMIAWPLSMDLDGRTVLASDPKFSAELRGALKAGLKRWKALSQLEKSGGEPAAIETMREEDARFKILFRSVEGTEKELPFSQLVRVLWPNQIGILGKLKVYLSRVAEFIFDEPRESNTEGGVFPAIFGTVMMTLLMSLVVVPFGVVAALYLREYAKQGVLVSVVRIAVNNLAGVPSIVFGVFGLGFFVYGLGGSIDRIFYPDLLPTPTFGTGGILWASLTLALLTVPVVVVATEEALSFVPKGIRDGSLACGATKWQTLRHVVLPSAAPGILTGMILAMARGAGEVAPLMITGVVKLAPNLPFDLHPPFAHFDRKFMHLGFHIYDVGFQSPNVEAAMPMVYATTLLLILVVVFLNLAAMLLRNKLRNRYRTSGF